MTTCTRPTEKFHIPNFHRGIETICRFFEKLVGIIGSEHVARKLEHVGTGAFARPAERSDASVAGSECALSESKDLYRRGSAYAEAADALGSENTSHSRLENGR